MQVEGEYVCVCGGGTACESEKQVRRSQPEGKNVYRKLFLNRSTMVAAELFFWLMRAAYT